MNKHSDNTFNSEAHRRIKDTGKRSTPARTRVLAALLAAQRAMSHQEMEQELAKIDALDRVTLYRVLAWLTGEGLAHRIKGRDRVWRFNAVQHEAHRHAHFHCTGCNQVYCLENLDSSLTLRLPDGYQTESVDLTLEGKCPACRV